MKIKSTVKHASFLTVSIVLFLVLTTSVFAVGKPDGVGSPSSRETERVQSRLTNGKLKSCQAREAAIKNRSTHLVNLVTNMESKFDAIATRVKTYYTSKVVPSGKTVSNYNTLVADIQTKKTAVQTALITAQTDANSFTCTGSDPKAQMTLFREDMQAVKSALKEYRTSIKNLIVAVRLVTGEENSESQSPKPTKSI